MSKRILSLVLCCAMLLTCISGLTLISSAAENKVAAFNATSAYRGSGLKMQTKDGFSVFSWTAQEKSDIWFNNYMVPNALGITEETKADELAITLDCYWQRGADAGNDWWQFNTTGWTDADKVDNYFNLSQNADKIESDKWTEYTVTRANQVLRRDGADSLFGLAFGDLSAESAFYVRGIKVVAKVGEDTYTALWGSYIRAKLDFSTGEIVGTNANITYNHTGENAKDVADGKKPAFSKAELNTLGLAKVDGTNYGMALYQQNSGFGVHVADIGLTGQDIAVTVEYYIPADANAQNATRYNMNINGKAYTLNYGGNGNNTGNAALSQGKWDTATFIVSGEDAAAFSGGLNINTNCWNHNNNGYYDGDKAREDWGGDYYFIRSLSFMPADMLSTPADPGYDYYDFTNAYATNPFYPDYTQPDQKGMVWSLNGTEGNGKVTENGMEMTSGTLYMNSTRALGKSDVALKFFFAEGTTGNFTFQYNADAEKNPDLENINFKNINPTIGENGVATVILNDAAFAGKQASGCSFRIYADGKTLKRVEVYTLADKTALKAAIDGQITDFTGKTTASVNAYKELVAKAQALYDDTFALQADVDAATNALTSATLIDVIAIEAGENTLVAAQAATLNNCQLENGNSNIGMANNGSYIEYEVDVKTAGWYKVTFNSANGNGEGGDANQQLTDGEGNVYAQATIKADGNWGNYVDYDLGSIQLKAGAQRLRVFFTGGCNFKQMTLNYFVNVDALKDAVAAEITDLTDYTAASAAAYTEAMTAAKAVLAKEDATQEEVDNALTALNAAKAALVKTLVDLPDPNLNQDANKTKIVDFEGKTALDLTTTPGVTASIRWEMGTLKNAFNVANTDVLDLEISADYYYVKGAADGDYELWLNTYDKDGNADPSFGQIKLEGEGSLGLKTGEWATFTATRTARAFGNGSQFGDLLIQAYHSTWAEGTHLYIAAVRVKVTLADGTVLTGTYNAKQPDKAALQAAVDGALTDLSGYTADSAKAYTDALAAAKAALEGQSFTQADVDNALAALNTAKDNLKEYFDPFAEINFANDQVNTVNGNILHNHPDEDDGDADNGIYKVADDVDAFGIKMSWQNHGFGFRVDNSKQWMSADSQLRLVVEYYAPSDVVKDNSRIGISFGGKGYKAFRFGGNDLISGMKSDELTTFTYKLTAEEVTAMVNEKSDIFFLFWNYNDDEKTGGDYIYITKARLEIAPDTTALEAAVNENLNLDDYKADSTAAYKEALEAAKAVLANTAASQEDIDAALAALNAAKEQLVALPSMLVKGTVKTHNGVDVLEFADDWAHFSFSERMGLDTSKSYDLDMTFYYASTGTPWWQLQLSDAEGNRYTENGKYEADGFQQKADWLENSNDEWTSGKVSFKGVKFPIDASEWDNGINCDSECDFGFHMCGRNPAPATDETDEVFAEVFIRGIQFTVKDAEGNVVGTALWGSKVEIPRTTTALEAAIADAEKLNSEMYTEASAKALADAIAAAKAVLADETADQDAIDAATKTLKDTMDTLELDSWDLIVESVTTTAGLNVKKGTQVQFIAVIKNVGTKTIPAGAKYGVAFSIGTKDAEDEEDGTISFETVGWSDNYKNVDTAPELKPGDTLTVTSCGGGETVGEDENAKGGYWTLDEIGEFVLRAFVNDNESDGIQYETDRDNNIKDVTLKVTEEGLNVAALTAEITKADALDLTKYTDETAKALTDALTAAKAVAANANATQAEVDKAAADLTAAIAALVEKTPDVPTTLGDVNGDGVIDTADAVLVLQYAAKLIDGNVLNVKAADVNGDGVIDTADAVLILQYAAKLIKEFPTAAK